MSHTPEETKPKNQETNTTAIKTIADKDRILEQARATARNNSKKTGGRKQIIIMIIALVTAAALAISIGLISNKSTTDDKNTRAVSSSLTVTRENPVTYLIKTRDKDNLPVLDLYEDPLCPHCRNFEATWGEQVQKKVESGEIAVRLHVMTILDRASDTKDYSSRVARAFDAASSDAQVFLRFHELIFKNAPREGKSLSNEQLSDLLKTAGATQEMVDGFNSLVADLDNEEFAQAISDAQTSLKQQTGSIGVPGVVYNGHSVDFSNPNWLNNLQ